MSTPFSQEILKLNAVEEAARIAHKVREQVSRELRRRGAVVGLSGGIDSSVVAGICAQALGKERVLGLLMPEEESSDDSLELGRQVAEQLGIQTIVEDITPMLRGVGCYSRRDEAVRQVFPEYGPGYKCKIVLPGILDESEYAIFSIVVESPSGTRKKAMLPLDAYLGVVAATNFKQRTRKMLEYYHADRLQFAVAGTPNRLEYDQGFFVKNGDGAADFKPIAQLYKTQVYQLAEFFGIPEEIRKRPPTTDTYSLEQSQEEFYFTLPYDKMDLCLYAADHRIPADQVSQVVGITPEQVERVYAAIARKRRAAKYLHSQPLLIDSVDQPEQGC
jgi:NAD+ synthase